MSTNFGFRVSGLFESKRSYKNFCAISSHKMSGYSKIIYCLQEISSFQVNFLYQNIS